jgi:hypothetical protein
MSRAKREGQYAGRFLGQHVRGKFKLGSKNYFKPWEWGVDRTLDYFPDLVEMLFNAPSHRGLHKCN